MATRRGTNGGRGGRRSGAPGAAYPNRTDMNAAPRQTPQATQPVRTAPGQAYGAAGAQAAAQHAIPLPAPTPMMAPTQRPNEPLTAGMPMGAGPGTQALTPPPIPALNPDDDALAYLQAVASKYPTTAILRLLGQT